MALGDMLPFLRKKPCLLFDFKFSWTVRLALDVKLSKWFIHHLFISVLIAWIWVLGACTADSLSFQEFSNHLHLALRAGEQSRGWWCVPAVLPCAVVLFCECSFHCRGEVDKLGKNRWNLVHWTNKNTRDEYEEELLIWVILWDFLCTLEKTEPFFWDVLQNKHWDFLSL